MAFNRVARTEVDGSCVLTSLGKGQFRSLKATYGDGIETATTTPMGMQGIRARTPGTYKVDQLKITFEESVWRVEISPRFPSAMTTVEMPIVVTFGHAATGFDSDLLEGARLVGISQAVQNDNKPMEIETTWDILQIRWTSRRLLINSPLPVFFKPTSGF